MKQTKSFSSVSLVTHTIRMQFTFCRHTILLPHIFHIQHSYRSFATRFNLIFVVWIRNGREREMRKKKNNNSQTNNKLCQLCVPFVDIQREKGDTEIAIRWQTWIELTVPRWYCGRMYAVTRMRRFYLFIIAFYNSMFFSSSIGSFSISFVRVVCVFMNYFIVVDTQHSVHTHFRFTVPNRIERNLLCLKLLLVFCYWCGCGCCRTNRQIKKRV